MDGWNILLHIILILIVALLFGYFAIKVGQNTIVGFLLGGVFLGALANYFDYDLQEDIAILPELGVSLLLFSIGLEFSLPRLLAIGKERFFASILQIVLTLAVAGFCIYVFGVDPATAFVLSACVTLSSTACVIKILESNRELDSVYGRNSITNLLLQDVAVIPLALIIVILGQEGRGLAQIESILLIFGYLLAFVFALYFLTKFVIDRLLRNLNNIRTREFVIILALIVGLGATWVAHYIGISPSLGAFLAGMFLGIYPIAHQVRSDVAHFSTIFLTLFFVTTGMQANISWIIEIGRASCRERVYAPV